MPCYHPIPAWRSDHQVKLHKQLPDSTPLHVPCGTCLGCRTTRAQHWALRCHLETLDHKHTCVTTLTYDGTSVPPTLQKGDFQRWMKRLRKAHGSKLRYFACGEYGERFGRPHFHALLFGLHSETPDIQATWPHGLTHTDNVSIAAINYVCNYTTKKLGWPKANREERLDLETGELYTWQPPFQLMSRRPGLGSSGKKHYNSWRLYAVNNGAKLSVPRYLKTAWEEQSTDTEYEDNEYEKYKRALDRHTEPTEQQLRQKEKTHYARQKLHAALRKYE